MWLPPSNFPGVAARLTSPAREFRRHPYLHAGRSKLGGQGWRKRYVPRCQAQPHRRKARPRRVGERIEATEHLAEARTFLAWVRTSLAILGPGFVVARFGPWLDRVPGASTLPPAAGSGLSMPIGAGIMAAGATLSALAARHHHRVSREIEKGKVMPVFTLVNFVGGPMVLIAAVMIRQQRTNISVWPWRVVGCEVSPLPSSQLITRHPPRPHRRTCSALFSYLLFGAHRQSG